MRKINSRIKNAFLFFLNFMACLMFIVALFFIFGIFSSCDLKFSDNNRNSSNGEAIVIKKKEPVPCDMAILVYMAADNNLESSAIHDFNEMEAAEIPKNATVLVLFDRAEGFDQTNDDWTGTRLYKISHDGNGFNSKIISERIECERLDLSLDKETELDMGKKETLTGFIESAKKLCSPKEISLVIWGHGSGWKSASNFSGTSTAPQQEATSKAFSMDSATNSFLTVSELRQGIENAMGNEKIDFIGFDTCFGTTIEVAYELKNCAKIMGGSAGIVSSDGWNYETLFNDFFENDSEISDKKQKTLPNLSTEKFSRCVERQFCEQYKNANFSSFTVLDLEKMEALYDEFNSWCESISRNITTKEQQTKIRSLLTNANEVVSYYSGASSTSGYDYYVDIFDMSEKILETLSEDAAFNEKKSDDEKSEIEAKTESLQASLKDCALSSWSAKNESPVSMGVFFALFSSDGIPFSSHPEEYFHDSKSTTQNLFAKNSYAWVPTSRKNISLLDMIFYADLD